MQSNTIRSKNQKSVNQLQNAQENTLKIIFTKIVPNAIIHVQSELKQSIDSYQCQQV
jgi:ABC-type dipeptide/oligopeptide/nickel transport system permease subunit